MTGEHATDLERNKRRGAEITFLRLVPGTSPVHRLWAGTKLLALAIMSIAASLRPTWPTLAVVAAVVFAGFVLGRVPVSALPRLPIWFLATVLLGALLSARSNAAPLADLGPVVVSLGGLEEWARLTAFAALLVLSAGLVGWTTPLGDIAPALARLTKPLRRVRLPVDEWTVAVALAIRSLPLLVDETRTMLAARRLRRHPDSTGLVRARVWLHEFDGLLVAAISASLRRARDVAEAMDARGGNLHVGDPTSGPRAKDGVVIAAFVALAVLIVLV